MKWQPPPIDTGPLYTIYGKRASSYEYNFGMALIRYEVDFLFQVDYWGGRNIRGGQVLDYLVFNPMETPVQIFGEYWHEGQLASQDRLKLDILENHFGKEIMILWGPDVGTYEDALRTVRSKIL